jgi:hypothetical protein
MAEDWMSQLAAQDQYDNTERDFQYGIRQTPWFSEFQQRFGEEPDLNTPDYNYRAAWAAGARPDVRDPGDNLLHWDSRYKGESHPNRFVNGVDTISGLAAPDERGFQPPPSAFEAAAARVRAPYRNLPAPGSNRIGQLAEQVTSMPSWADVATQQMAKDKEAFQTGGIGSLLADTSVARDLAGGFGGGGGFAGRTSGVAYANPKLRAKAEALQGKYPQYAEQYPDIGPPALKAKLPDPKNPGEFLDKPAKGEIPYASMEEALARDAEPGFFLEKKLTPEAAQFQKDRLTIQEDMDLHGYKPYFDPKKRFDVDPKHYGPFDDTSIAAAPKTAKTDAEWAEKYGTPEARARLQEGFKKGQTIKDSADWYFMGQLEKEYIKELGAKEGRAAFKREFGDMMSATTGGASPYNNFMMSQYANVMAKRGERMPERSFELPFPVGGRYAAGNIAQAQKYIDEGQVGFSAATNPKRYDFSSAFAGNKNAATTDEQMMNAIKPGVNIPEWYGPATRVIREEAQKAGVDPRGFQDVGWAGLKSGKVEAKGKTFDYEGPMINHVNRSIETTSRLTGMSPAEVVKRGLIRKEIPMYGVGGLTALGGLAAQDEYGR